MRLLRTKNSDKPNWQPMLSEHSGQPYAILSHRWASNPNHEVLFADIEVIDVDEDNFNGPGTVYNSRYSRGSPKRKPGFSKLAKAAQKASKEGFDFIWIDTCCIDKTSSAELSEAINSMWTWYANSSVCYAYLEDVDCNLKPGSLTEEALFSKVRKSVWWTRGWTLQELLAPENLLFFDGRWRSLRSKKYWRRPISDLTGIDVDALIHKKPFQDIAVNQRMSWARSRVTTRPEDIAYCLLGLFDINMPLLYGEGARAFIRLQEHILAQVDDISMFVWTCDEIQDPFICSGLLAPHPRCFKPLVLPTSNQSPGFHGGPPRLTGRGIEITGDFCRAPARLQSEGLDNTYMMLISEDPVAKQNLFLVLRKTSYLTDQYVRICLDRVLHKGIPITSLFNRTSLYVKQCTVGPFAFENQQLNSRFAFGVRVGLDTQSLKEWRVFIYRCGKFSCATTSGHDQLLSRLGAKSAKEQSATNGIFPWPQSYKFYFPQAHPQKEIALCFVPDKGETDGIGLVIEYTPDIDHFVFTAFDISAADVRRMTPLRYGSTTARHRPGTWISLNEFKVNLKARNIKFDEEELTICITRI